MPTRRRRHAITETERVEAALTALRGELGNDRIDLGEIVVLGAELKLQQLRNERRDRSAVRKRLAERVRSRGLPMDPEAAATVRQHGWTRS